MGDRPTFYVTTPIYYVNDVPHIGHAYTTVAADVLARFARLRGQEVFFLTGLDEHGQKVQQAAQRAGIDPQAYCDRLAPQFERLWARLSISNDDFVRTTQARHQVVVQEALQRLYDKGEIYRADYTGWYCTADERFWTEKDLVNGLCPDCRRPVERLSEKNYFFRMSRFQQWLVEHIEAHPEFIKPRSRRNEVLGFLQQPLEDLSISRPRSRLSWGIELPFDRDYVTYVWFDALVNYISIPGYTVDETRFARWWPADVHLIGKDILTTHSVYWSTMLQAMGLPPPRTIFAHGWWTVDGEKMSKSRGNVVDPNAIVETFGADAFRYFLLREVPFGQDGDFSRQALIGRINTDLANDLGNLLSRTITLIERFADGLVPEPEPNFGMDGDDLLKHTAERLKEHIEPDLADLQFNKVLETIWGLVQQGNQYIDKAAPWVLAKRPESRTRLASVLYNAGETLRVLSLFLAPFMPQAAADIRTQLGISPHLNPGALSDPRELAWGGLPPGTKVTKGKALFPRIEKTSGEGARSVSQQAAPQPTSPLEASGPGSQTPAQRVSDAPASAQPVSGASSQITIEDFQKIQLKTAKVLSAERVPKSDKLLTLRVDLVTEQRQIVAGIGKKYAPEQLVGKTIVIVANLKPAKLMGIESQGMVLAAGDKEVEGLATFIEDVPAGIKVK
ncbi:methionine--tRNA ligase [Candidatus Nitrospira bockiana]